MQVCVCGGDKECKKQMGAVSLSSKSRIKGKQMQVTWWILSEPALWDQPHAKHWEGCKRQEDGLLFSRSLYSAEKSELTYMKQYGGEH